MLFTGCISSLLPLFKAERLRNEWLSIQERFFY